MSEVEDTINRIKTHKSVYGLIIVNHEGRILRTTFPAERKEEGENIAKNIPSLTQKGRSTVRDLDGTNDLIFLRIKTKFYEIMVAPDKEFMLIVVQGKGDKKEDND